MEYYNDNIKKEFLNSLDENVIKVYDRVLRIAAKTESFFNTDLYDMSIDQIKDVVQSTNPLTPSSSRSNINYFKKYINWAIEQGLSKSNLNKLDFIDSEWHRQFVDFTKKLYLNENELFSLEEDLVNGQDAVILRLLFEGIEGRGCSELLNIKKTDIKEYDNTLLLHDVNGESRTVEVTDRCKQLLKEAAIQIKYINQNGNVENPRRYSSMLMNTSYVIRTSKTRGEETNLPAKKTIIHRRLSMISELFEMPYLTPKNIWKSGQIKMAKDLYERDGVLGSKQLYEIAEKFNLTKMTTNNQIADLYNITQMKDYITPKNLKELYNIDIEA